MKYLEVYLNAYQDCREVRIIPSNYFRFYNTERSYKTYGYMTPAEAFILIPAGATSEGIVDS